MNFRGLARKISFNCNQCEGVGEDLQDQIVEVYEYPIERIDDPALEGSDAQSLGAKICFLPNILASTDQAPGPIIAKAAPTEPIRI